MSKKSLLIIIGLTTNIAWASLVAKSDLTVNNIEVGKMEQDVLPAEFSIQMNFENNGSEIKEWQLGFYMPRSFDALSAQNINPNLQLQMCDLATSICTNLRYIKSPDVRMRDFSQGYFTILEPLGENFPIKENGRYSLQLKHNNQWSVGNVSSLPQSFFIIDGSYDKTEIPKIYTINTELTQYSINGYNQNLIDDKNNNHIQNNWQTSGQSDSTLNLIPAPVRITNLDTNGFSIPKRLTIHNNLDTNNAIINWWSAIIREDLDLKKPIIDNSSNATDGIIITSINEPKSINNSPEGYRLTITSDNITIETLTQTGMYYALQSLRQLMAQYPSQLPAVTITDYPRFKYRGIILDTARHYFTVDEIKTLIDVIASQKLNTLHLHFSDDEAFRLELPDYPTLAATAGTRGLGQLVGPNLLIQNNLDNTNRSQPKYPVANTIYSSTYSSEDIKNIINYANLNQITIIPEIDLPGHARALIKAMPQVMTDPNDHSQFMSVQGYSDDVLPVCTYNTNTSIGPQFTPAINTIIKNVANLFNQQTTMYNTNNEVSLGGDEVSANAWTNDTSCSSELNGMTALEKSHAFFSKIADANSALVISGWQELVQNDDGSLGQQIVPINQTGHIWVWSPSKTGIKQAANLANKNYPTVLAYADKTYFDLAYNRSMYEPGFSWATPYSDTYSALSMSQTASKTEAKSQSPQNILGIEGALWSENLPSYDHLMYMALPKMAGLSEAAWSPSWVVTSGKQLNWQSLAKRLGCGDNGFLAYLYDKFGINYRGYPNGISKEIPEGICPAKVSNNND